jgi:hypothetical protein
MKTGITVATLIGYLLAIGGITLVIVNGTFAPWGSLALAALALILILDLGRNILKALRSRQPNGGRGSSV